VTKDSKAIRVLVEGDDEVLRSLDGQSRICNWLYNHLLEKANVLKDEFIQTKNDDIVKTLYTERGLRNLLPALKQECPFLKSVHSSPLKNTALRLSASIQAHQKSKKGKRKGKVVGWPRFRSWKADWFSLLYDEPGKGFKINGNQLTLSLGMGKESQRKSITLTIHESHLLSDQAIRNLRIIKQAGCYYAIFTVAAILPEKKPINKVIALDPNHKNLVYGVDSDGKAIEVASPFWLKAFDKRIDEIKSKRDRCEKRAKKIPVTDEKGSPCGKEFFRPSRRWQKYNNTLEKALHKRREQTKTLGYTIAHRFYKQYDCVAIGNYTPNGNGTTTKMRRAMNNRSMIGRFKATLKWVAEKSGKTYLEYDEEGTTRTCCQCGYRHGSALHPSIRQWECPGCRAFHLRDENAALNGLKRVFNDPKIKSEMKVSLVPGSGLDSVTERWAWRVLPSGIVISRGQNGDQTQASRNEIESVIAFGQKVAH
jgi:putative transposase